jgi:hypothetical protein
MALQHSSAHQCAGLLHLPPELLHQICSHINPDLPLEAFPEPQHLYFRANINLAALCRCSRIFFPEIARPHLCHNIVLDPKDFPILMKTLLRRHELGSLVRHLVIMIDVTAYEENSEHHGAVEDQELVALLESLGTKPHSFRQFFDLLSPLLQQMKKLETLVVEDAWCINLDMPIPDLTKLSKLRLELGEMKERIAIGMLIWTTSRAPRLSTLDIEGFFRLKGELAIFQNITHLRLTGVDCVWESAIDLLQACINLSDLTLLYDE